MKTIKGKTIFVCCVLFAFILLPACSAGNKVTISETGVSLKFVSIEKLDSVSYEYDHYLVRMKGEIANDTQFHLITENADVSVSSINIYNDTSTIEMHAFYVDQGFKPLYLAIECYNKTDKSVIFKYYSFESKKWIDGKDYTGFPAKRYDYWGLWD